ncbi:MAG: DNA-protecting protein DprA [Betaproteobacteria bacterium]|nr:DNA-protecting protein DprA [Betaproteobacteria bacterium]
MPLPPPGAEPEAWLALDLIPGLGGENTRKLLAEFGSPAQALRQSPTCLRPVVGDKLATAVAAGASAEKLKAALGWLEQDSNHLLTLADEDYPPALLEISDPPPILYLKGRRELLNRPAIAIVGSRNATPVGLQNAEAFAQNLSVAGLTVISGMALGIDAAAHRGGLAGSGSSIAVVGTGLDLVYPARNKVLAQELAANGLIVSEFSLGTPALAQNFPRRNRLISGLARGVLVVEAALASGSLITARLAGEQGREVFAIPGSIHSPFSKGCHQLIKQGAKLVDDANDILVELQWSVVAPIREAGGDAAPEDALLTAMGYDPVSIDHLVERAAMSADQVSARLTELEIDGVIASLPGGKYQRLGG